MIRRLLILLAVALVVEAGVFLAWNRDLLVLSQPAAALGADPAFDTAARMALARPRISRRLLAQIARTAQARGDGSLRIEALRRLAAEAADDPRAKVNLADALREAGRYEEADVVYAAALAGLDGEHPR